jgi:hypothetical protein
MLHLLVPEIQHGRNRSTPRWAPVRRAVGAAAQDVHAYSCNPSGRSGVGVRIRPATKLEKRGKPMSTNTLIIILLIVLLLGGGGFFMRGRR